MIFNNLFFSNAINVVVENNRRHLLNGYCPPKKNTLVVLPLFLLFGKAPLCDKVIQYKIWRRLKDTICVYKADADWEN